eukprot:CAMPEP_0182418520 /NCGR_PEP_ID=MMETSP1167-20130531/2930_1 /TAXON_ID=2988 /ORGANISM="Mallomonas Sp, Strain CCMP3275" /LENGTH=259 /DNA_ID=CAMNT_0024592765 /DNA_START=160 /DNA_END=939 /DNA_ORIENTATION=-
MSTESRESNTAEVMPVISLDTHNVVKPQVNSASVAAAKIDENATDNIKDSSITTMAVEPVSSRKPSEEYRLAVLDNSQIAATAVEAAKTSVYSLAFVVSSVAEATVSFSRSDEAVESLKAAALAGNALSDAGKNTGAALGVVSEQWRSTVSEMKKKEIGTEDYLGAVSTTISKAAKNVEVKNYLSLAGEDLKRSLQEMTTVYLTVVTSLGREIGTSKSFKQSIAETVENLRFLLAVVLEATQRTTAELTNDKKELPPTV